MAVRSGFNRRAFLKSTIVAPMLSSGQDLGGSTPDGNPRNLLLIVVDGWRSEMMGCAGNPQLRTPHMDTLAARGVRFSNAFSAHSVCMPSRASIFTGRYPSAHGVWANGVKLSEQETTLAHALARQGYATGSAGKHHFEPMSSPDYPPKLEGVDSYYGFQQVHLNENIKSQAYLSYVDAHFPEYSRSVRRVGSEHFEGAARELRQEPMPEEANELYWIVSQSIDFIKAQAEKGQPFFAFTSFKELIPPCDPPRPFHELYDPADMPLPKRRLGELETKPPHYERVSRQQKVSGWQPDDQRYRQIMAGYYGETSFIDKLVGRLVGVLEELDLMADTMIVLTGDHGLCLNDHWIWRHGPWLYDQVIKVPLVVCSPEIEGGRVADELVESVDLMPTVLESLNVPVPAGVQGRSFRALLEGTPGAQGKESVWVDDRDSPELLEFPANQIGLASFHVMALRTKDSKLIYYPGRPWGELYDLRSDPDELDNLWYRSEFQKQRQEMEARLLQRVAAGQDPLPTREYPW